MLNTLGKVLARAVAEKLSLNLAAVLHKKQNGFLLNRGTGNALITLEAFSFELAVVHDESAILGMDFQAAFPSLSRSWLRQVLLASGCAGWILNYLEEMLSPFSSALDWRSQRSPWIHYVT
eukprot:2944078-Amphidinium_carterae.1